MEKFKIWVPGMIILGALFMSCGNDDSAEQVQTGSETQALSQSGNSYNFQVETLEGETVSLNDYQGKVVLVDFWDTWCPPCKAEIPHFIELYDQYNSQGFEMLGIAFGREGAGKVTDFVADYGINYPNAINGELFQRFQISSIPTTYLFDRNGNMVKKYVGYNDKSVFENDIKAYLN